MNDIYSSVGLIYSVGLCQFVVQTHRALKPRIQRTVFTEVIVVLATAVHCLMPIWFIIRDNKNYLPEDNYVQSVI